MEYLFNGPRFYARNPSANRMYGTTSCEAVHGELARFFRQTMQQTSRCAIVMVDWFCFKKVVVGMLQRLSLSKIIAPAYLLHTSAQLVRDMGADWSLGNIHLRQHQ